MFKMCKIRYTYRDIRPTGLVDPVHMFAEFRSVTISVSVVLCHKQERVNHFMEESLGKQKIGAHVFFISIPDPLSYTDTHSQL